jgi:hypothetical protein
MMASLTCTKYIRTQEFIHFPRNFLTFFFFFFFFWVLEFLNFKLQEDGRTLHTQLDGKKIYNIISYGEKEYVVSVN